MTIWLSQVRHNQGTSSMNYLRVPRDRRAYPARVVNLGWSFAVIVTVDGVTGRYAYGKIFEHELIDFIFKNNIRKDFDVWITAPILTVYPAYREHWLFELM